MITLFFVLTNQPTSAQSFVSMVDEKMDELLSEYNVPGIAILVIENGEPIVKKGFGFADVDKNVPMTPEHGFNIGSISKMFTTWGIMALVEAGKLDLDSSIQHYLTRWEIPNSDFDASKVTIRQLLSHSAGFTVHGYPGFPPSENLPTLEESLNGENGPIRDNEPVVLISEPGSTFKYSGGGFTVLQLIIEEVSGQPFSDFMDELLFKPLNMNMTSFDLSNIILANSASAYDEDSNPIYLERFTAQAAAGLHTTLDDLSLFTHHIHSTPTIISKESFELITTPISVSNGRYALGHMAMKMGPISVVGHAGSNDGWESAFFMHPESNSSIVMLTNSSNGKDLLMSIMRNWVRWKSS